MMQSKSVAPPPRSVSAPLQNQTEGSSTEILVKIAIPIALAVVAGLLNASAVSRQMQTQPFYAFKEDLPIGHMISVADLHEVRIGGELGGIPYLRPASINKEDFVGRVLNRDIKKGELIVESQFGGISLPKARMKSFELPRNSGRLIARSARPGQSVTVQFSIKNDPNAVLYELGPFEVAPVDQNYKSDSHENPLVLNIALDKSTDRQVVKLLEVLENESKYYVLCLPHRAKPKSQVSAQEPDSKQPMDSIAN